MMPSRPSPTLSFDEPTQQSRPWGATEAFDPAGSRDGPGHTWREHSGAGPRSRAQRAPGCLFDHLVGAGEDRGRNY